MSQSQVFLWAGQVHDLLTSHGIELRCKSIFIFIFKVKKKLEACAQAHIEYTFVALNFLFQGSNLLQNGLERLLRSRICLPPRLQSSNHFIQRQLYTHALGHFQRCNNMLLLDNHIKSHWETRRNIQCGARIRRPWRQRIRARTQRGRRHRRRRLRVPLGLCPLLRRPRVGGGSLPAAVPIHGLRLRFPGGRAAGGVRVGGARLGARGAEG
mmetsp:Transcript_13286/g.35321  ORF Transcript_13286/g.35321 Transcript_13286/m.35321 type:complete len:211 (+) Transcript_13286:305-937(+)